MLVVAERLISAYEQQEHPTRSEIEEYTSPVINTADDVTLVKGFNKLLLDRSEFSHEEGVDYGSLRKDVFNRSAGLLKQKEEMSYREYYDTMVSDNAVKQVFSDKGIYHDLPENERLISFKTLSAKDLLSRYNCSLVQSLLLTSKSMTLNIRELKAAKIRQMFKYLKFFRLLSKITRDDEAANCAKHSAPPIRIVIDGPMSILENTQKYGLQLASFFPTVCHLTKWELEATVKYRGSEHLLQLDEKSRLTGHYNHYGSYVPEEITVFKNDFQSKTDVWSVLEETPFIPTGNQELIFPDLSFENKEGKVVHLELFHRWHSTQLISRLKYLSSNPEVPLSIGVDRSLYKKDNVKRVLDGNNWFTEHGFLFNDFPGVEKVTKCLNAFTE